MTSQQHRPPAFGSAGSEIPRDPEETEAQTPTGLTPERVRQDVEGALGHEVDEDANLLDEGLDSIRLMALSESWRTQGSQASFLDLMQQPTLRDWAALIFTR